MRTPSCCHIISELNSANHCILFCSTILLYFCCKASVMKQCNSVFCFQFCEISWHKNSISCPDKFNLYSSSRTQSLLNWNFTIPVEYASSKHFFYQRKEININKRRISILLDFSLLWGQSYVKKLLKLVSCNSQSLRSYISIVQINFLNRVLEFSKQRSCFCYSW